MYVRIKQLIDNSESLPKCSGTSTINTDDIIDKYLELAPFRRKTKLGNDMTNYFNRMILDYSSDLRKEIIELLNEFKIELSKFPDNLWIGQFINDVISKFMEILLPMNVEVQKFHFYLSDRIMVGVLLNSTPQICELQTGNDKCILTRLAFERAIDSLLLCLQ